MFHSSIVPETALVLARSSPFSTSGICVHSFAHNELSGHCG